MDYFTFINIHYLRIVAMHYPLQSLLFIILQQTVKATSQPRFIMPANTPTFKIINTGVKPFTQLPPGTTLVAQQGSNLLQGLTMIPSNYLAVVSYSLFCFQV